MWVSHHCPAGLSASPCPMLGGLHPVFVLGPTKGRSAGRHATDYPFMLLAECRECGVVLGREQGLKRIMAWVPDQTIKDTARKFRDHQVSGD